MRVSLQKKSFMKSLFVFLFTAITFSAFAQQNVINDAKCRSKKRYCIFRHKSFRRNRCLVIPGEMNMHWL